MTISYSDQFLNLLLRWKGSLWKAIWKHLLIFLILYYTINAFYRTLSAEQRKHWIPYIRLFDEFTKYIPLTFLLGFYVAMIVRRWWACCQLISWPDHLLFNVSALVRGHDAETRIIRRTIARYAVLTSVLAWRSISLRVLKRYPTDEHLVQSGLMTREEMIIFKNIRVEVDPHQKWFIPINWIQTMMVRCFEKGTLTHTNELRVLLDALEKFRNGFFQLFIYDWMSIPLVYTQVSTISVYGYFAFALIGRQYPTINERGEHVDIWVPIFTILQFFFYVGWLKVGEDLMFPFGADDEDFEFNYILDRNLEVAFLIVDELHNQVPPVYVESLKDGIQLLHTHGSATLSNHPQRQHLRKYKMKDKDKKIVFSQSVPPHHRERTMSAVSEGLSTATDAELGGISRGILKEQRTPLIHPNSVAQEVHTNNNGGGQGEINARTASFKERRDSSDTRQLRRATSPAPPYPTLPCAPASTQAVASHPTGGIGVGGDSIGSGGGLSRTGSCNSAAAANTRTVIVSSAPPKEKVMPRHSIQTAQKSVNK